MRANEIMNTQKELYHGSDEKLSIGTVLTGRGEEYEQQWSKTDWYKPLEYYRPTNMIAHKDAVFMVDDKDDIDAAGGGTEYIFTMKPTSEIQRHDVNWSTYISLWLSEPKNKIREEQIKLAANNYWNGIPWKLPKDAIFDLQDTVCFWEYLTKSAIIVNVEEF